MHLPPERIGPYVRALRAGLDALVPSEDHVPLGAAVAHLDALDPVTSGELLLPAEVSDHTGMPAFAWMERARSEQAVARRKDPSTDPSEAELQRASALDAALGGRMRSRRALYAHLRRAELLPVTRLQAAVRRMGGGSADFTLRYDRMAPDGRWLRVRAELRATGLSGAPRQAGPLVVDHRGRLIVDDALQHLLTRHFATPLLALRAQLEDATECEVLRLGRAWVGPFWFPGVALPAGVPEALGRGLLLHLAHEVVGADIPETRRLDPLQSIDDVGGELPPGHHLFLERRFAGSAPVLAALRRWLEEADIRTVVAQIGGGGRRL